MTEDSKKVLMVQCQHCKDWYKSQIQFDEQSFITATISRNTEDCPHCKKFNTYSKDNMKFM